MNLRTFILAIAATSAGGCAVVQQVERYGIRATLKDQSTGASIADTRVFITIDDVTSYPATDTAGKIRVSPDRRLRLSWLGGPAIESDPEARIMVWCPDHEPLTIEWFRHLPERNAGRIEERGVIDLGELPLSPDDTWARCLSTDIRHACLEKEHGHPARDRIKHGRDARAPVAICHDTCNTVMLADSGDGLRRVLACRQKHEATTQTQADDDTEDGMKEFVWKIRVDALGAGSRAPEEEARITLKPCLTVRFLDTFHAQLSEDVFLIFVVVKCCCDNNILYASELEG
jgi:hypothetical protein